MSAELELAVWLTAKSAENTVLLFRRFNSLYRRCRPQIGRESSRNSFQTGIERSSHRLQKNTVVNVQFNPTQRFLKRRKVPSNIRDLQPLSRDVGESRENMTSCKIFFCFLEMIGAKSRFHTQR